MQRVRVLRLNPSFRPSVEESLDAPVAETLDHYVKCNDTRCTVSRVELVRVMGSARRAECIRVIREKVRGAENLRARFSPQMVDDLIYGCVFKAGRPALGPCVVGVTVKGACRVKFSTVSEGNLIC